MPSRANVEWRGPMLRQRLVKATVAAIDDTTADAAREASLIHSWAPRTGNLERQIVTEHATVEGQTIRGSFGATYFDGTKGKKSGFYGLFLEYRDPWLRPAADFTFFALASRIRQRMER